MNRMNAVMFRTWAADHAATRCIGSLALPSSLERDAVMAVTAAELLAAVPYGDEAVIYHQVWDGQQWRTQAVGEFPFHGTGLDALYDFLFDCPRCGGSGVVWVVETDEAGHHHRVDVPCPRCMSDAPADEIPF
jgi:hypothetical protein